MYSFKEKDFGLYEGKTYPLETPMIEGKPDLNKPQRGGPDDPKKFVVYVKDPKTGNVKKINFGNEKGFGNTAKINDPEARKNFASRHNCEMKKDKLSPGYWSCNLPRYAAQLGLKGGGNYFW